MTLRSQRNLGTLKPGLIILLGLIAIALVIITILLLPPPNIRRAAERLIPPNTTVVSELNYGDLIGISGSTEASLTDVAEFYRERFRLGRGTMVSGGISSWSESSVFGRFRSGVVMPYTTEGFAILLRDKTAVQMVVASRATNENATSIEVFCEQKSKLKNFSGLVGAASRFTPPQGNAASSASSLLMDSAMFTSTLALTDIATHYFTSVLGTPPLASTNWTVSPTGRGMVSIPKRTGAESVTFLARTANTDETVLIHCFRSAPSTQTHVLVGCVSK